MHMEIFEHHSRSMFSILDRLGRGFLSLHSFLKGYRFKTKLRAIYNSLQKVEKQQRNMHYLLDVPIETKLIRTLSINKKIFLSNYVTWINCDQF